MIESPCIRICTLDASGEVCLGCFRNLEEIGAWAALSDAQRRGVLERLPDRRREHEARVAARAGSVQSCGRCGAGFSCGALEPGEACWCTEYPPVAPSGPDARCLCPACLRAAAQPRG